MRLPWSDSRFLLVLLTVLSLLTHLWALNTPPTGVHAWRQCDTAAVARNFYEEGMNIFQPRIDARGSGDGRVGMEFPLVNWVIAWTYFLFGFQHWSGRLVVLLFSLLGNGYFFLIVRRFVSPRVALLATLIFIFGPLYFYYSRNVMPDVPALTMALGSLYFYLRWEETGSRWNASGCLVHLALTGLIKIPYLSISILMVALYFRSPKWRSGVWKKPILLSALALAPAFSWWVYADHLNSSTGFNNFPQRPRLTLDPQTILSAANKVLISGVPEYLLSYPLFIFLLVFIFIYLIFRRAALSRSFRIFLGFWLLAAGAHLFLHIKTLSVHNYCWISLTPPLALAAGIGLDYTLTHWKATILRLILIAILLSIPYFYIYRFNRNLKPSEYSGLETICDSVIPRGERVIVGPDPSPCIMLYYAHRKGWSFPENVTAGEIQQAKAGGADYLVSSRLSFQQHPDVQHAFPVILYQDGGLAVLATPQGAQKTLPLSVKPATNSNDTNP